LAGVALLYTGTLAALAWAYLVSRYDRCIDILSRLLVSHE
jgi:hypothetical protein